MSSAWAVVGKVQVIKGRDRQRVDFATGVKAIQGADGALAALAGSDGLDEQTVPGKPKSGLNGVGVFDIGISVVLLPGRLESRPFLQLPPTRGRKQSTGVNPVV